jgi:RNA polymerase sigma factor (sigma-70 family)
MAERLIASPTVQKLINKYKPLEAEEEEYWVDEYNKTRSERSQMKLLNAISKIFAAEINNNQSRFIAGVPEATYDDIFQQMVLAFFKGLKNFDPKKSRLSTWTTWEIMPIVKTPLKVMGNKFARKHKVVDIDTPINDQGDTIASLLPDTSVNLEKEYSSGSKKSKLMSAIKKLDKQSQEIILALFKFNKPEKWVDKYGKVSATSIAKERGISVDRQYTQISKILDQLRSYLK